MLQETEHTKLKADDIGRYVLLPGDPGRCEKIAAYFDDPKHIAQNREYNTYTGTLLGEKVSVVSTGIGCPSAAIAVEELIMIGADTFIRIGTSGGMQPEIRTGDVAVVNSAIRDEGTTLHYMPIEFPAIADLDVVLAMREGAKKLGIPYHVGPTQSKDSFFGEIEPDRMPVDSRLNQRWKAWTAGGTICSEMEASTIFILSSIHRKRAGGVMLMGSLFEKTPETPEEFADLKARFDISRPIQVAIEGLKVLIQQDLQNR
ncbi:MAG: nucleoside phosphorylase [Anaerolineae bacterium]|jgi:uridine phosphorylase|nr:nucleoside phosphorylase [Anaerolineae bacterium]